MRRLESNISVSFQFQPILMLPPPSFLVELMNAGLILQIVANIRPALMRYLSRPITIVPREVEDDTLSSISN